MYDVLVSSREVNLLERGFKAFARIDEGEVQNKFNLDQGH